MYCPPFAVEAPCRDCIVRPPWGGQRCVRERITPSATRRERTAEAEERTGTFLTPHPGSPFRDRLGQAVATVRLLVRLRSACQENSWPAILEVTGRYPEGRREQPRRCARDAKGRQAEPPPEQSTPLSCVSCTSSRPTASALSDTRTMTRGRDDAQSAQQGEGNGRRAHAVGYRSRS